jgi:hypothetical protein
LEWVGGAEVSDLETSLPFRTMKWFDRMLWAIVISLLVNWLF